MSGASPNTSVTLVTLALWARFRYSKVSLYRPTDLACLSVSDKQDVLGGFDYGD